MDWLGYGKEYGVNKRVFELGIGRLNVLGKGVVILATIRGKQNLGST